VPAVVSMITRLPFIFYTNGRNGCDIYGVKIAANAPAGLIEPGGEVKSINDVTSKVEL